MTVLAVSFDALTAADFWIGVGVLAGVYAIFTLGLQLNVGFTGIFNFGQAGFMAIGAYTMGILVVRAGWSMWAAMAASIVVAMTAGVLIGLPSLRLRADYFAIATIAFAEIVRYVAVNARGLTGGSQGLLGFDDAWLDVSDTILGWLPASVQDQFLLPLLIVVWLTVAVLTGLMMLLQRTPWGRVLRAIREDEDAARALGKNVYAYKLQSIAIAAALGAIAGWFLALNLAFIEPSSFEPLFTFIGFTILVLGGLASYLGVAIGALIMWTLLEATRFIDLPLAAEKVAALRFVIVGLALILLVALRPQGILGKRQEMVLHD
ncbi:MAG TPA: branched-chain amino acid ABC transporter permease [Conexibacter sp.]|nr:branched-chain amino acid ABC transporter permease [Conexibacter sp.]